MAGIKIKITAITRDAMRKMGSLRERMKSVNVSAAQIGKGVAASFGAAAAAIGGMVVVAKKLTSEFFELERSQAVMNFILKKQGETFAEYEGTINGTVQRLEDLTDISKLEANDALTKLLVVTRDMDTAMSALGVATALKGTGMFRSFRSIIVQVSMALRGNLSSLKDYIGLSDEQVDAIANIEDSAKRSAAALDLLKKSIEGADIAAPPDPFKEIANSLQNARIALGELISIDVREWSEGVKILINKITPSAAGGGGRSVVGMTDAEIDLRRQRFEIGTPSLYQRAFKPKRAFSRLSALEQLGTGIDAKEANLRVAQKEPGLAERAGIKIEHYSQYGGKTASGLALNPSERKEVLVGN